MKHLGPSDPFPIQGGDSYREHGDHGALIHIQPCTIPRWLAEVAYEVYAERFGDDQSLDRIAERGGFGRMELLQLLKGHKKVKPFW